MKRRALPRRRLWMALAVVLLLSTSGAALALQNVAATVTAQAANLRTGPGPGYGVLAQAPQGTLFTVVGRNQPGDWLEVCCANGASAWVYSTLVMVEGSLNLVPVTAGGTGGTNQPTPPSPPPPPPPQTFYGWKGEYFSNSNLQGAATAVRDDPAISFRWSGASPAPGVPGSQFSARWTRTLSFPSGDITFYAQVDDGVRLWLDSIFLLDEWRPSSLRTYSNTFRQLNAGPHTIRVEYFQAGGDSAAVVWWEQASQGAEWRGDYYNNLGLQGAPALTRSDPQVSFQWGTGSPDSRIQSDNFSARWTRQAYFEAGNYLFKASADDGVRVYLDGVLIVDEWHDSAGNVTYTSRYDGLGEGVHTVVVEFYERTGNAAVQARWDRIGSSGGFIP